MSINIGSGFSGMTEKEKKQYISITLDESLYAIFPFLKQLSIKLWFTPKEERNSEKSPGWRLSVSLKQPRRNEGQAEAEKAALEDAQQAAQSVEQTPADEEILF